MAPLPSTSARRQADLATLHLAFILAGHYRHMHHRAIQWPASMAHIVLIGIGVLAFILLVGCRPARSVTLPTETTVSDAATPSQSAVTGGRPATPPTSAPSASSTAPSLPGFDHVILIIFENKDYEEIIGSADAPYLNRLASEYAVAERYYAVRHPSLPNYLALMGGETFGITTDCTTCFLDRPILVDQLETHGKTWKAYLEDLPQPCFLGAQAGGYALKHNPFLYFQAIRRDPARCQRVVPLSEFGTDLQGARLPNFVWITPNLRHAMHDGTVAEGDRWLASFLPPLLAAPAWRQSVVFITWDEGRSNDGCCGVASGGRVPLLVVAPQVRRGYRSAKPATHYSLLRTIEDIWKLPPLGHSGDPSSRPLLDFFS